jgi:hypothetical protein
MSIGDLATILTVAGVSIYVLGLTGLAIPIRREFTGDISTAWYAVSLVPKTVVAGQGVRIWIQRPAAFATALLVVTVALRLYFPLSPLTPEATFLGVTVVTTIALLFTAAYPLVRPRLGTRGVFPVLLTTAATVFVGVILVLTSFLMLVYPEGSD